MTTLTTRPPAEMRPRGADELGRLTLEDLLCEESLRLRLAAGHGERLRNPIRGALAVEADDPAPWLHEDWVVLTSGSCLREDAAVQRRLVADLDEAGAAALGLCLGEIHDDVPWELIDEADCRGVPVFTVPNTTPAVDVIAFVQRNLLSDEALNFSRLTALQRFLMDALGDDDPTRTILERLAEFLQAKVGLLTPSGRFEIATADDLPAAEILEALGRRQVLTLPFSGGGVDGHAFRLDDLDGLDATWLVVAVQESRRTHPLAKAAGAAAVPILRAVDRMSRAQRTRDSATRRASFEALLDAETRHDARVASAQIATWDLNIAAGVAVAAFEAVSGDMTAGELLESVLRAGARLDRAMFASVHDKRVSVLLPAPVSEDALASLVSAVGTDLRAGVGRTVTEPFDVRSSLAEALLAIDACPPGRTIGRYDDLDLGTLIMQELPLDRLGPKIDSWLDPLRAAPRIFETLVAYLGNSQDVGRTAEVLHVHPNSVRYRLARAEELIGASVRSPITMLALHVAVTTSGGAEPTALRAA